MKLTHTPIPTHIFLELKQATVFLLNNSSHELKKKIIIIKAKKGGLGGKETKKDSIQVKINKLENKDKPK